MNRDDMSSDSSREASRWIHAGGNEDPHTGASSVPIYQASTFRRGGPGKKGPYVYSRANNPTREALEKAVAELEEGAVGLAFASGMAAITAVLLTLKPGDHVVAARDLYGGTIRALTTLFDRWGIKTTFVDACDPAALSGAFCPETRMLWMESPSNPLLRITDLEMAAVLARERGAVSVVDNTFATPWLQKPISLGFDVVVHSATKFLAGHSDVVAGVAVAASEEKGRELRAVQIGAGGILGPQDSWLTLRGLRTLPVRMERQQASAEKIARFLSERDYVKRVWYPVLEGHPGREIHLRQSRGGGAVLSFELEEGRDGNDVMEGVKLLLPAVSLGGVESILSWPAAMSHAMVPKAEREALGISGRVLRLSVGLEDPEDIIGDIDQAVANSCGKRNPLEDGGLANPLSSC